MKLRAKLASLNHCAVPLLSRTAANLCWYYNTIMLNSNNIFSDNFIFLSYTYWQMWSTLNIHKHVHKQFYFHGLSFLFWKTFCDLWYLTDSFMVPNLYFIVFGFALDYKLSFLDLHLIVINIYIHNIVLFIIYTYIYIYI